MTPPAEVVFERDPANAIIVSDDIRITHPLLKQQREYWRAVGRREIRYDDQPPHLNITVHSRESQQRALRILQALFAAIEKRGHSVAATNDAKTNVTVLGETFDVAMRERSKQVLHQPTPKEKADAAKYSWMKPPPYDLVPTGELTLTIEGVYGTRHNWADGKKQRIGGRLNSVIEGLVGAALQAKARREGRKRDEELRQEAERQRKERVRKHREIEQRIDRFDELVTCWHETQDRREFLVALR